MMSASEAKNKMKTLSEGAFTDRVLTQMAGTFVTLVKEADFSVNPNAPGPSTTVHSTTAPTQDPEVLRDEDARVIPSAASTQFGGLVYNINIHLPESRDQSVYDALFKALKEHLR
jgi:hypothetical protein